MRSISWILTTAVAVLVVAASCVDNSRPGSGAGGSGGGGGDTGSGGASQQDAGGADRPAVSPPFLREYADRQVPPFVAGGAPPPAAGGAAVAITVDAAQVLRTLPRSLYGNNVAVWNGDTLLSETAYQRLSTAGVSILRFPGGSTADGYHFDGAFPAYALTQPWKDWTQPWTLSTAEYMRLVRRLGATPVITANHGYAKYDTTDSDGNTANAARLAADWVEYCNAPNDGGNPNGGTDWAARRAADGSPEPFAVAYWEIGNEVFGNWETGYDPVGSTYAANFNVMADAMRAVDPTIAIGLVVDPTAAYRTWTRTVLSHPGTAARADFLIVHTYFGSFPSRAAATAPALLGSAVQIRELKTALDALVTEVSGRNPADLPYYMSEYNVTGPTNPLQISLASGLFIAKVLGELAASGWAAASLWDTLNGYDSPGTFGPGDHGFLSAGQPGVPDLTPRPTYYDFYFFTRNFGDRLVPATSGDPKVTVYASTFTGRGVGVVVVNEAAESRSLSLSIAGGAATSGSGQGQANLWILTGPSLESSQVTLNGVGNGLPAGGPLPEAVPPYVVATAAAGRAIRFDVPAGSVASVVVY